METLGAVLLILIVIVYCALRDVRRSRAAYVARFPPLTNAEFLAGISPGVRPDVALKVRQVLSDVYGVEPATIHPQATLIEIENALS